jgi:HPt (histidine-containing phosphotransfer) domain-containing protein
MGPLLGALLRDNYTARLGVLAHKCSGAAALFGASALQDALAQIESSVRAHQTDSLDVLVRAVEPLASRTIAALARVRFV